jgi:hypothetical protein
VSVPVASLVVNFPPFHARIPALPVGFYDIQVYVFIKALKTLIPAGPGTTFK